MTTETRIGASFALALAIIMALGVGAYVSTQQLREANRWAAHTHLVLDSGDWNKR